MAKQNYDITHQMHVDLIDAYKRVCGKAWSQQEAYELVVKEPAPRYYVTPKQAYQVILPMVKGDFEMVNMMLPLRRKMYYALFEEVLRLSEQRQFIGKSLWQIIQFAVIQPASEFYISAGRVSHIRCWLKNGTIRNDGSVDESKLQSYARTREFHRRRLKQRKEALEKWTSERMS